MKSRYLETTSCLSLLLAAGLMMGVSTTALANPEDGVVAAGSATITSPSDKKLDIHQSSQNVVIDWRSFDIAPDEHTQFYQSSSSSTALNRIHSGNASQILGKLSANGNVMIVNQSGIIFGKDSVVDVNGLVASTSDITNNNFMNGNLLFDNPGNPNASITNQGKITAKDAGLVGLVAPRVTNSGTITAKLGKVQLASGDKFSVDLYGDGLMNITLSDEVTTQLVENTGSINAEGGSIEMTAAAGAHVVNSLINIAGELQAPSVSNKDGKITISGNGSLINTGTINAGSTIAGTKAGTISINAKKISNQGKITADSTSSGLAGSVSLSFGESYSDNESAITSAKSTASKGGTVSVIGANGSRAYISGTYDVSSALDVGGTATITAEAGDLKLFGAHVKADGKTGGGTINIGGEYQGTGTTAHASTTGINFASYLSANATDTGDGGHVIVWSDDLTQFAGHASAKGGYISGNGGLIELSSKDTLQVTANADTDASATNGSAGSLLLDPKNIIVATGGISGGYSSFEFIDANPDGSGSFAGQNKLVLANGNIVVTDGQDSFSGANSGGVYLYNGATGALISALFGSSADDYFGDNGTIDLGNGNFVVTAAGWDNGANVDAGAVVWFNGTTGKSGLVNATNALVGTNANDLVGLDNGGNIALLGNGNLVITSTFWDDGAVSDVGAVTFIDGSTGITGAVSAANSLIGSTDGDSVGYGIQVLTNGNYVVLSYDWDNGGLMDAGAATWGSGTTGVTGVVSAANSLVGASANDAISRSGITALSNGNYVVASSQWTNGANANAGAVTWGNGTTGTTGVVDATNSIVGTSANDYVGEVTALSNGNYVVSSSYWDNGGAVNAGFAAWADGNGGTVGTINATNAIVGTKTNDYVGIGLAALSNGNYVINSYFWGDGVNSQVGASTWANGLGGTVGAVGAGNSIVGTTANDMIADGSIIELTNGNYLIQSYSWDNGGAADAGAVTWANGLGGTVGVVGAGNSIVGGFTNDSMGNALALTNGNYIVYSNSWDNGGLTDAGAVRWGDGTTGTSGLVTTANSLYGLQASDEIGSNVSALANGNYLVISSGWDNGGVADAGAVTLGNGATGTVGGVDATNSLVGTTANDWVGGNGFYELTNGNLIIISSNWDNGAAVDAGAVTWMNGITGLTGAVGIGNSLVGTQTNDSIGSGFSYVLSNGNFILGSSSWNNGGITGASALTWIDGTVGITGALDATNSLVGSSSWDYLAGDGEYFELDNGYIAVLNSYYHVGADQPGAITFFRMDAPTVGTLNSSNSFFTAETALGYFQTPRFDSVNQRVIAGGASSYRLYSIGMNPLLSEYSLYTDSPTSNITLDPTFITNVLNNGTAVTLQANNDITINDDIIVNNTSGNGGTLTFQAGRSILINADIFTDNGNLNIFANENLSTGVVDAQRDAGDAVITMATGTSIDAGTGDVSFRLDFGTGKTNKTTGDITLETVNARNIIAFNNNKTGDIILETGGALTATAAAGDSIILASGRNFINNIGAGALNLSGTARWLVYSTNPTADTIGGLANDFRRFSCTYGGTCPTLESGNGLLYSNTPLLTITPDTVNITYGDAVPALSGYTYSVSGYLGADAGDDSLSGSLTGATSYTQGSNAGTYNINHSSGTLASDMGYGFTYANNATALAVAKKTITAAFSAALTKTYGDANPTLGLSNFTFTGLYVAGDAAQFTSFTPDYGVTDANTGIGSYAVTATIGTNTNYIVSNTPATTLTIDPRALTVTTQPKNIVFGNPDPVFTGSNNLTAYDAGLISWVYAPVGYGGAIGSYTIDATATDTSTRLVNYTRTDNYGLFTVNAFAVPETVVPPTVLYVSQTPPANIIHNGTSAGNASTSNANSNNDYLEVSPNDIEENKPYTLFNGWVIIDPLLVKKLNLLWSKI